jgi:cephalosporin hydroxylase
MSNLVPFSKRDHGTVFNNFSKLSFFNILENIKFAKWNTQKWKGLTLMKDPMSLTIYQQLLQDKKFKTIIEVGTFEGGSALWMEDINKMINNDCIIYTLDIDSSKIKIPDNSSIIYKQIDVNNIKSLNFEKIDHPLLVIEDAHVNVKEVLEYFNNILKEGDYLFVEDTIDDEKYEIVANFVKDKNYLVDTTYCDMWGFNYSYNLNSILKKH